MIVEITEEYLMSVAGKILAKIVQQKWRKIVDEVLPESKSGFRSSRYTKDMIVSIRQIHEKAVEQQQELFIVFIDFSKIFDTVDRELLWRVLILCGCPESLLEIICLFHNEMRGIVCVGDEQSISFPINHGTKQSCILAPNLFMHFSVLIKIKLEASMGVYIRTRHDGKHFNLARLKAKTKATTEKLLNYYLQMIQQWLHILQQTCSKLLTTSHKQQKKWVLHSN